MFSTTAGKDDVLNSQQSAERDKELRLSQESFSIDRQSITFRNDDDIADEQSSRSSIDASSDQRIHVTYRRADVSPDREDIHHPLHDTDPELRAMDTVKMPAARMTLEKAEESWLRRNMRFSTEHFWKKAGIAVLGVLSLVHAAGKLTKQLQLSDARELAAAQYEPGESNTMAERYQWSENSKRYAGTTQEVAGMSWYSYTGNLTDALQSGQYSSLQEAHESVERTGVHGFLHYSPQIPVSSAGTDKGWQIGEQAERRVILIQGEGNPGGVILHGLAAADGQTFSRDVNRMKATLKSVYGLDDSHITILEAPSTQEVKQELQRIGEQSTEDTEVLFYYVGHALANKSSDVSGQGSYRGSLSMCENGGLLSEQELMDASQDHMSHVKSFSVVLDACYTGSFIY